MDETPYIIHTKTQNLSFLKMHRYLRDRKIKNNKLEISFTNSNDLNRLLEIMNLDK